MFTSFSTALSALSATSTGIDVIGNNLANLNTPGFKTSVVSFHDLVTQSLGAGLGETQVGFGVGRPITLRTFSQGAIQTTSGPLDAAIQGDGFFIVKNPSGATLYTRGGNLEVDRNGNLTTATGERLQGWANVATTGAPDTNTAVGDIVVPVGSLKPAASTTKVSLDLNLDASAATGAVFSRTLAVYDSLGNSHTVKFDFTKSATANEWGYSVSLPDADVTSPPFSGVPPGTLKFDSDGKLTDPLADAPIDIPITGLANSSSPMDIKWNLWDGTVPRLTQYAAASAVSANSADGSPAANLTKVGLADGGRIVAQYSNGDQIVVGQVAMALVRNPESLIACGNNNYSLSALSALPAVGLPDSGGRGGVLGGAVEASTVDIAKEFTNLIVLQRAYQANTKVITTVDQLSQETINLKQ